MPKIAFFRAKIGYDNKYCQKLLLNQKQFFFAFWGLEMDLLPATIPALKTDFQIIEPKILPDPVNPAKLYLDRLKESGRRGMEQALNQVAGIFSNFRINNCYHFNWAAVRFQHTATLGNYLAELKDDHGNQVYKPATINHLLSALRGVLKITWQLE